MAKKTIHISDLSGEEVPEGKGATISIRFKRCAERPVRP